MAAVPKGQKFNLVRNKKTGKTYKIPAYPAAPKFKPRDRKRGNKFA